MTIVIAQPLVHNQIQCKRKLPKVKNASVQSDIITEMTPFFR